MGLAGLTFRYVLEDFLFLDIFSASFVDMSQRSFLGASYSRLYRDGNVYRAHSSTVERVGDCISERATLA